MDKEKSNGSRFNVPGEVEVVVREIDEEVERLRERNAEYLTCLSLY